MGKETLANTKKQASWWWLEDDQSSGKARRRSTWLQSTISALNGKTKAMLKLIEEDADSFAQRAEMYYKKRPELISLVEDFYRAHRSLAERYDLLKSEPGSRLVKSQLFTAKSNSEKLMCASDRYSECSYDTYSLEESTESEVDDPEPEDGSTRVSDIHVLQGEEEVATSLETEEVKRLTEEIERLNEVKRLTEEIERLKEANMIQRAQLKQKDEEKKEVIRQLSMTVEVLKEDNVKLRRLV